MQQPVAPIVDWPCGLWIADLAVINQEEGTGNFRGRVCRTSRLSPPHPGKSQYWEGLARESFPGSSKRACSPSLLAQILETPRRDRKAKDTKTDRASRRKQCLSFIKKGASEVCLATRFYANCCSSGRLSLRYQQVQVRKLMKTSIQRIRRGAPVKEKLLQKQIHDVLAHHDTHARLKSRQIAEEGQPRPAVEMSNCAPRLGQSPVPSFLAKPGRRRS
ncbi:hypothetical protein VTK73DRAFT_10254 [Phialemonium thermophilum]|uniref:Uncharacterized protein n=1 Tax=Phialemonium thermophilum TaxID=223376 RepID=A0ABR3VXQ4_9PEZI